MNESQQAELSHHLEEVTYLDVKSICAYIKSTYQVDDSPSGMRQRLHAMNFCYKKPHPVPAKADKVAQEVFVAQYIELNASVEKIGKYIYFMDAIHPEHQTKMAYG